MIAPESDRRLITARPNAPAGRAPAEADRPAERGPAV